jgi:outer membrane protein insertion porin family
MGFQLRVASRLILLAALFALPALARAEIVNSIKVEGNERIEPSAVTTYLGIATGDDIERYDLDLALKKLYDTGFFSDVGLDFTSGVLTVHVSENPSINDVIFEGNDQIDKDDLEKEISLKSRSIYTRPKVQSDLKRLLDVYRRSGRYSAEITPQIIPLDQNRVNLVYNIEEGPKALIEKITFIGNESYTASALESVVSSSRERWYQFLSDSDKYDPDRLQYDQELLRRFYFENGYADMKVKSAIAELSPQRDAFYITFTLEEGPQYHFGTIDVTSKLGKGRLPDMKEAIGTKTGDLYNASEVEDSIDRMVDVLGDSGFAFVEITPDVARRPGKDKIIDLTYNIAEGPKVYVERINIFGNVRTLDEVIRREFRLAEGDAYSSSKLKRTQQRLNNLGFFEKVDIKPTQGSTKDKTQLDVKVEEKSTGEVSFGAGFSTVDGALADIGVTERNFLGRGQLLRARGMFAARRQQFDFGFTEPYFLNRELEAGFDLYKTVQDYSTESSFDRDAVGGVLRIGYNLGEKTKHQLRYSFEKSDITNINPGASLYIQQQKGENSTSMVGHSIIYDDRDSKQLPTRGLYARVNQDVAGLGGDDRFLRHELQAEYYYPIAKKWTFTTAGSAGHIFGLGRDVRINQRFFVGSKEIRGFANSGIGPRDATTDDALGGNIYYAASAELRFPLGLPEDLGVTGAAFVDTGSLWSLDGGGPGIQDSSNPRAAAGVGVAWSSPFGPIRIDFARAFLKESYDQEELVRFSFGTRF